MNTTYRNRARDFVRMNIGIHTLAAGALIFDASRWAPEQATRAFDGAAGEEAAQRGRGGVRFLQLPFAEAVLRRYRRGGMVARISEDWYFWRGGEATRPFREFRLTAQLFVDGLPVPRPLAARYVRSGLGYRAALITQRIAHADTLANRLAACALIDWSLVGRTIARFHRRGLWHADLNAHNVMIGDDGAVWLIDLDRGVLRAPDAAWAQGNLDRLQRSLFKLGTHERIKDFSTHAWPQLLTGYQAT
jgi:3-deoxy-D-manno-octulosonic acid kinase